MKVMIVNNLLVYKILGTAAKFVNGNPPINNGRVILPFLMGELRQGLPFGDSKKSGYINMQFGHRRHELFRIDYLILILNARNFDLC